MFHLRILIVNLPKFPTRPVRPIRCTYSSTSLGKSKLITCFTLGISKPLAATYKIIENDTLKKIFNDILYLIL